MQNDVENVKYISNIDFEPCTVCLSMCHVKAMVFSPVHSNMFILEGNTTSELVSIEQLGVHDCWLQTDRTCDFCSFHALCGSIENRSIPKVMPTTIMLDVLLCFVSSLTISSLGL